MEQLTFAKQKSAFFAIGWIPHGRPRRLARITADSTASFGGGAAQAD